MTDSSNRHIVKIISTNYLFICYASFFYQKLIITKVKPVVTIVVILIISITVIIFILLQILVHCLVSVTLRPTAQKMSSSVGSDNSRAD